MVTLGSSNWLTTSTLLASAPLHSRATANPTLYSRGNKIVVNLLGRLNKCAVISPRFDVRVTAIEKWATTLLPSRQFGYIVLTTSYGIMDHVEAKAKHTGGKVCLSVYCWILSLTPAFSCLLLCRSWAFSINALSTSLVKIIQNSSSIRVCWGRGNCCITRNCYITLTVAVVLLR